MAMFTDEYVWYEVDAVRGMGADLDRRPRAVTVRARPADEYRRWVLTR